MSVLSLFLTVIFIIVCVLLILLVSVQDEKNAGLSGVFGGSSGSTFGAETASVVVRITAWLAAIFFVLALTLAIINTRSVKRDSILERYNETNPATEVTEVSPSAAVDEPDLGSASGEAGSVPAPSDTSVAPVSSEV